MIIFSMQKKKVLCRPSVRIGSRGFDHRLDGCSSRCRPSRIALPPSPSAICRFFFLTLSNLSHLLDHFASFRTCFCFLTVMCQTIVGCRRLVNLGYEDSAHRRPQHPRQVPLRRRHTQTGNSLTGASHTHTPRAPRAQVAPKEVSHPYTRSPRSRIQNVVRDIT